MLCSMARHKLSDFERRDVVPDTLTVAGGRRRTENGLAAARDRKSLAVGFDHFEADHLHQAQRITRRCQPGPQAIVEGHRHA